MTRVCLCLWLFLVVYLTLGISSLAAEAQTSPEQCDLYLRYIRIIDQDHSEEDMHSSIIIDGEQIKEAFSDVQMFYKYKLSPGTHRITISGFEAPIKIHVLPGYSTAIVVSDRMQLKDLTPQYGKRANWLYYSTYDDSHYINSLVDVLYPPTGDQTNQVIQVIQCYLVEMKDKPYVQTKTMSEAVDELWKLILEKKIDAFVYYTFEGNKEKTPVIVYKRGG